MSALRQVLRVRSNTTMPRSSVVDAFAATSCAPAGTPVGRRSEDGLRHGLVRKGSRSLSTSVRWCQRPERPMLDTRRQAGRPQNDIEWREADALICHRDNTSRGVCGSHHVSAGSAGWAQRGARVIIKTAFPLQCLGPIEKLRPRWRVPNLSRRCVGRSAHEVESRTTWRSGLMRGYFAGARSARRIETKRSRRGRGSAQHATGLAAARRGSAIEQKGVSLI